MIVNITQKLIFYLIALSGFVGFERLDLLIEDLDKSLKSITVVNNCGGTTVILTLYI